MPSGTHCKVLAALEMHKLYAPTGMCLNPVWFLFTYGIPILVSKWNINSTCYHPQIHLGQTLLSICTEKKKKNETGEENNHVGWSEHSGEKRPGGGCGEGRK